MKRLAAAVALSAALLGAGAPAARAAQPPADQPPLEGFVPAASQEGQEQLPATPLVLTAYGFAWAAVLFYVWLTWRRLGRVERELKELEQKRQEPR